MTDIDSAAARLAQVNERLWQESRSFDQSLEHNSRWFVLKITMGWIAAVALPAVMVGCALILWNYDDFPEPVLTAATATLFVDVIGMVMAVWKIVFKVDGPKAIGPVTVIPADSGSVVGN